MAESPTSPTAQPKYSEDHRWWWDGREWRPAYSDDSRWWWDGTQWKAAFSEDGQWWWNGSEWRAASEAPVTWTAPVVGGSILAALYADLVAGESGVMSNSRRWASLIVASAFATLREAGAVTLSVGQSKGFLGRTSTDVHADVTGAYSGPGEIEKALHSNLGERVHTVGGAIISWIKRDYDDPFRFVTSRAGTEEINIGLVQLVDEHRNIVSAHFKGKYSAQANRERIAEMKPQAEEFAAKMAAFRAGDPQLYKLLLARCESAIASRRKQEVNDNFDTSW